MPRKTVPVERRIDLNTPAYNVRFRPEDRDRLVAEAEKYDMSVAQLVRTVVVRWLATEAVKDGGLFQ